jgi:prevent-host-death family protein
MIIVTIREAKANLSRLIRKAATGEEVIIVRGSKPVARLVAMGAATRKRLPGSLMGKLTVGPEFFESLPAGELKGWE